MTSCKLVSFSKRTLHHAVSKYVSEYNVGPKTSAHKIRTPKNHPKERIQLSEHGESLNSFYNVEGRTQLTCGNTDRIEVTGPGKGTAVPLQAWSDPEGSRKLRFPDYMRTAQDGGKVASLTHRPPLPPCSTHGTHFC